MIRGALRASLFIFSALFLTAGLAQDRLARFDDMRKAWGPTVSQKNQCHSGVVSKTITKEDVIEAHKELRKNRVREIDGFFGPKSTTWKIFSDYRTAAGGWTSFAAMISNPEIHRAGLIIKREKISGRYDRTSFSFTPVIFDTKSKALDAALAIHLRHQALKGQLGDPNPSLQSENAFWVLASMYRYTPDAYEKFIAPLTTAEKDKLVSELKTLTLLFGIQIKDFPATWKQFEEFFSCQLRANGPYEIPEEWLEGVSIFAKEKSLLASAAISRVCGSVRNSLVQTVHIVAPELPLENQVSTKDLLNCHMAISIALKSPDFGYGPLLPFPFSLYKQAMKRVMAYDQQAGTQSH